MKYRGIPQKNTDILYSKYMTYVINKIPIQKLVKMTKKYEKKTKNYAKCCTTKAQYGIILMQLYKTHIMTRGE